MLGDWLSLEFRLVLRNEDYEERDSRYDNKN